MTLPRKLYCPIHTFVELSKCSCAVAESARNEGKERAWLYERIESLTSENTRLRALLENNEQRLKDTEFLYNGYFVLATEAGKRPGSAELSAAARRFDEVLDDAVNSALAIKEKIE